MVVATVVFVVATLGFVAGALALGDLPGRATVARVTTFAAVVAIVVVATGLVVTSGW